MPDSFKCCVVTPEAKVVDEHVTYATLPAWDGQIGIAPRRAPLLIKLGVGSMRLDFTAGGSRWYLVEGGFAQMLGDELTLLSTKAVPAEQLVESDANREWQEAHQRPAHTIADREARDVAVDTARAKRHLAHLVATKGI